MADEEKTYRVDLMTRVEGEGSFTLRIVDGELVDRDGSLTGGGADDGAAHMLAMQRETRELSVVVADLEQALNAAVTRHGELRNGIASRQAAIDAARTEAHDAELAIVSTEKDVRRLQEEEKSAAERSARVGHDIDEMTRALQEADGEESLAREEIESAKRAHTEAAQELAAAPVDGHGAARLADRLVSLLRERA